MRRAAWILLVLLVLSFGSAVQAQQTHEVWTYYFDCNLNSTGWSLRECDGGLYTSGLSTGAYRHIERYACGGATQGEGQWYYWNGSTWVEFEGPPGPNC